MSFQFVENGKIDGTARRLIRSHVMKGKNSGKIRHRPTQKGVPGGLCLSDDASLAEIKTSTTRENVEYESTGCSKTISSPQPFGNTFSSITFPCELHPYMRDLIYQFVSIANQDVYPIEFCDQLEVKRLIWFQYLISDEAFFHSVMAMSEVMIDALSGKEETSPRALQHLSHTYRCIGQNIRRDRNPSDATIGAVMSMALHEDLRGHADRSKVHMDALQRMVELRGGLTQIADNRVFLHKIYRVDIEYSLHAGSPPRFYHSEFPGIIEIMLAAQPFSYLQGFKLVHDTGVFNTVLREILIDLLKFCHLLNADCTCFKFKAHEYQEALLSISYRLLSLHPLEDEWTVNSSENGYYLGTLAFMTTMLFQSSRTRRFSYDLLVGKLRHLIDSLSSKELGEMTLLHFWLLFIGGISVVGDGHRVWLLTHIVDCATILDIRSWKDARDHLKCFPWIDTFHDRLGQDLWNALHWNTAH